LSRGGNFPHGEVRSLSWLLSLVVAACGERRGGCQKENVERIRPRTPNFSDRLPRASCRRSGKEPGRLQVVSRLLNNIYPASTCESPSSSIHAPFPLLVFIHHCLRSLLSPLSSPLQLQSTPLLSYTPSIILINFSSSACMILVSIC
jgi:hypothetical protein